ncbi:hypothetical protein GL279_18960 [Paracoccus limosus]|uniref:Arc-like DNA binding domain-containing protein n=1 Tax=Paracoccus limosus TaxID=913252 RepID=A0A844H9J9_9RHOB|nr:hypothetical protein [Paracoccus limosus]MTH36654.1 hypothetical protein [Paracoccus limosus]
MHDETPLVQFKLLLPARLKDAIAAIAQVKRRSLSQEIVATLEERYPGEQQESMVVDLPSGMLEQIKRAADARGNSINQVVVDVLEREFPPPQPDRDILGVAIDLALPGVRAASSDEEALQAIEAGNRVLAKTNLGWRLVLTHVGDKRAIGFADA